MPAGPRFHRRPAARPDELVAAALAVFGERGFRATTLEEVAARAGVSKGTVYLYFASKDDLFRAVVESQVITLIAGGEAMAKAHAGSAAALLEKVVRRMWEAMSRTSMVCLARLVQAELTQFPEVKRFYFEQVIQRHRRLLRTIAARGVRSGEFRPDAVIIVPRMVPSLVMQLNQNRFLFGDLDQGAPSPGRLCDAMLSLVLQGIGATGERTATRRHRATTVATRRTAKGRRR